MAELDLKNPDFDITNWRYWCCPLDTRTDSFGPFQDMAELWGSRRSGDGGLPSRQQFDFPDFRGWWGRIAIARFGEAPGDIRFTLWGTQLTSWWGVDYSGRQLGEAARNPEAWRRSEGRYFEAMRAAPFIGIAAGGLDQHDRGFIHVMSLDLPLAGPEGLTHVLACHIEVDRNDTPEAMMPDCPLQPFGAG